MNGTAPLLFLGLVAIFQNEGHIMEEWIRHYQAQGVDHFWLMDNNSSDCGQQVIAQQFASNPTAYTLVTLPGRGKLQTASYKKIYAHAKSTVEWLIVADMDEFFYARRGSTVASVLRQNQRALADVFQVCVPWRIFGTSGIVSQPKCVVSSFVRRAYLWPEWVPLYFSCKRSGKAVCDFRTYHNHNNFNMGKCLLHMSHAKGIKAHVHVGVGRAVCEDLRTVAYESDSPDTAPACVGPRCPLAPHQQPSAVFRRCLRQVAYRRKAPRLFLNHYKFQSETYMRDLKAKRPRISGNKFFNVMGEFRKLGIVSNDRVDTKLRDQRLTSCQHPEEVTVPLPCSS